jgi:hypothetical protein
MSTGILLITVLGSQLGDVLRDPRPGRIALGALLLVIPITLALLVQRWINTRAEQVP